MGRSLDRLSTMKVFTESSSTRMFVNYIAIKTYDQGAYAVASGGSLCPATDVSTSCFLNLMLEMCTDMLTSLATANSISLNSYNCNLKLLYTCTSFGQLDH